MLDTLECMLDDAAARGDHKGLLHRAHRWEQRARKAQTMETALAWMHAADAALFRALGIVARFSGFVVAAQQHEQASEDSLDTFCGLRGAFALTHNGNFRANK